MWLRYRWVRYALFSVRNVNYSIFNGRHGWGKIKIPRSFACTTVEVRMISKTSHSLIVRKRLANSDRKSRRNVSIEIFADSFTTRNGFSIDSCFESGGTHVPQTKWKNANVFLHDETSRRFSVPDPPECRVHASDDCFPIHYAVEMFM